MPVFVIMKWGQGYRQPHWAPGQNICLAPPFLGNNGIENLSYLKSYVLYYNITANQPNNSSHTNIPKELGSGSWGAHNPACCWASMEFEKDVLYYIFL